MSLHVNSSSLLQFQTFASTKATVRAETLHVDCGLVPNTLFDIQVTGSTSTLFTDKMQPQGGFATISMLTGPSSIFSLPDINMQLFGMKEMRTMYFLTNALLDIDANLLPQVNMTVDLPIVNATIQTYLIACGARLVSGNATVNATSGQLLELVPSPEQTPNTSSTWEILDMSMNTDLGFDDTYFNGSVYPFTMSPSVSPYGCGWAPTMYDIGLMTWLGDNHINCIAPNTFVLRPVDMQNALARLLATSYFTASLFGANGGFQKQASEVYVTMPVLQLQLNPLSRSISSLSASSPPPPSPSASSVSTSPTPGPHVEAPRSCTTSGCSRCCGPRVACRGEVWGVSCGGCGGWDGRGCGCGDEGERRRW
ncbi:hypothetical protein OG21DRAFT_388789 [Imleria badia]|nr:hypothetical protein OG21DRAFT_388789 [Imleria badia]